MSLRETVIRHQLIINKLRVRPYSWNEINEFLDREAELMEYEKLSVSQRTFQRDIADILSVYGISIINDPVTKKYRIHQEEDEDFRQLEALDVINLLKMGENKHHAVSFEKRRPLGTKHLFGLLHALNNRIPVSFTYHKFYKSQPETRTVEPYLLKESKNRWYLVGKDSLRNDLRTFGLDRIADIQFHNKKFVKPPARQIEEYYTHCFGIIRPEANQPLEEIILSFEPTQGRYILSHPLHENQEILENNDREIRVRLRLYITHDLIMELLSHGRRVRVLQPEYLRKEMLGLAFKG